MNALEPLSLPPDAREALYATGHWLLSEGKARDAASVFRVMLHSAPEDERGWLALGACHEALEQDEIALELYGAGTLIASSGDLCLVARARLLRCMREEAP